MRPTWRPGGPPHLWLLLVLVAGAACGGEPTGTTDPVAKVASLRIVAPAGLLAGDTTTLRVDAFDASGTAIGGPLRATWTVSDTSIAVIDSVGHLRGLAPGDVQLTARVGTVAASAGMHIGSASLLLTVESPALSPTPSVSLTGRVRVRASCTMPGATYRPCRFRIGTPTIEMWATDRIDVELAMLTIGSYPERIDFEAVEENAAPPYGVATSRYVFAPPVGPLTLVAHYAGEVVDFDGANGVYRRNPDGSSTANQLWYAPAAGTAMQVTAATIVAARIVAPGQLWYTLPGARASNGRPRWDLFRWDNGTSTRIAAAIDHFDPGTEGRYVAWTMQEGADTVLYRYDLPADVMTRIASGVPAWTGGPALHYVDASGQVAYIRRGESAGVYLSNGSTESLVASGLFDYVRSDGYSILGRTAADSTSYLLRPGDAERLSSSSILPVNVNGWVIYGVPRAVFPGGATQPSNLVVRRWDDPRNHGGALARALLYVRSNGDFVMLGDPAVWGTLPLLMSTARAPQVLPLTRYAERAGRFYYFLGGAVIRVDI